MFTERTKAIKTSTQTATVTTVFIYRIELAYEEGVVTATVYKWPNEVAEDFQGEVLFLVDQEIIPRNAVNGVAVLSAEAGETVSTVNEDMQNGEVTF